MPLVVLVLIFIVVPLAELYVILKVGDAIGPVWTILLLAADSVLGSVLLVVTEFSTIASVDVASGSCQVIQDTNPELADRCELVMVTTDEVPPSRNVTVLDVGQGDAMEGLRAQIAERGRPRRVRRHGVSAVSVRHVWHPLHSQCRQVVRGPLALSEEIKTLSGELDERMSIDKKGWKQPTFAP